MKIIRIKVNQLNPLAFVACAALLLFTVLENVAYAAPVALFKMSTATPRVGQIITFNGSTSICSNPSGCSYTWQWFWRSPDGTTTHLGGQMGRTRTIRYAFSASAAAKPYVIVSLKVGEGRVRRSSTASVAFRVLP
ncbi:hypothetical protein MCAMS1_02255 [biofilm metagenome]